VATENPRRYKVFFSHREATAGTPDTNCFFEGRGTMTLPEPEYQFESDEKKLGSGELGMKQELQAVWTPFTYKCARLSEIAYFLSYFQGKSYAVSTSGDLERHELWHLGTDTTTLPTFTMEFGTGGTGNNQVISGCMINEINITLSSGGNGVVDATFSGFGNRHQYSSGAISANTAGDMDSTDEAFDFDGEPYVNYKRCSIWIANAVDAGLKGSSVDFADENLGAGLVNLSTLINSITITGSNGISAEDLPRAGSGGIINTFERSDRVYTIEINIRKDDSSINTDTLILADTQKSLEIQFSGKYISGTDPYGIDFVFPVVQVISGAEGDGSPTDKTIPLKVFEDSDGTGCDIFVQSEVTTAYNAVYS
jgi:hypothetical protein